MQMIMPHLWYDTQARKRRTSTSRFSTIRESKVSQRSTRPLQARSTSCGLSSAGSRFKPSAPARCFNSILPYRFSSPAVPKTKWTCCGTSSPREVRPSWNSASIRSARGTAGCRTDTDSPGKSVTWAPGRSRQSSRSCCSSAAYAEKRRRPSTSGRRFSRAQRCVESCATAKEKHPTEKGR